MRKKTINGREIEYLGVIHHTTRTRFKLFDRVKILLGKEVVVNSEIYTSHEHCMVVGSDAKACVPPLIIKKSPGMQESIITKIN